MREPDALRYAGWMLLAALAVGCSDSGSAAKSGPGPAAKSGPGGTRVYVTLHGGNEISVLDGASNRIIDHIPVGKGPAILLATPNGRKLYTANWVDNTVSAVTRADQSVKSIALPSRPLVIAVSPDSHFVYAGLSSNQIAVIDTAIDSVSRSITMPSLPMSVVPSRDGATLYVAFEDNTLEAISASTGEVERSPLAVGTFPAWIEKSIDGTNVYTLNFLSSDVSVVDTSSWQVLGTISTGVHSYPIIGEPTPDGRCFGVTDIGTADVMLIDTGTHALVQTVKLHGRPVGINFSPDSKHGYAVDFGPNSLARDPIPLLLAAIGGAASTGQDSGTLTVFDPISGHVTATTTLGNDPTSVVVLPE